ncbi:Protein Skeletor, isoforms B/C [Orchesella cincta]|uniref:Protein Skeletor, isoforms B/C n=1 Tax=Orchesella cincta TaxID=48709 RepID=A0A1D2N926_ORCCI|nr:Protein Skeletor, isoforms B/C [Orchesella cincta]
MAFLRSISFFVVVAITLSVANGAKIKKVRTPKEVAAPVVIPAGFVKLAHKVSSGEITIKDSRTISIKSFSYDGAGPDAYFWVGKGTPTDSAAIVKGRKIADENGSYDVIQGYDKTDIELILPADITFNDIDYLSVYCVSFHHLFGYVKIPKNLNVPEYSEDVVVATTS